MDVLIWAMTGIAIWHFAVFVPDRFWGGIVGAFVQALAGALIFGAVVKLIIGGDIDDSNLLTMVVAAIGSVAGLGIGYWLGVRRGEEPIPDSRL